MTQITAIIPNYNNTKGLLYVLEYLKKRKIKTIVVDNKPTDEKKTKILDASHLGRTYQNDTVSVLHPYSSFLYLPQEKNLGFAKAVNLASKQVGTEWMLILNDDIKFNDPETIEKLYKFVIDNGLMAATPIFVRADGALEN